jgi:hypothetical protein
MAFISVLRDGENLGEAVLQREMAFILSDCPVVGGVGTGYSAGVVGKMNGAVGANPNHFSVSANGTNTTLTIQPGYCWIVKDSGSSTYDPRVIYVVMNAPVTLVVPANAQGTTRVDTICLRFDQSIAPDSVGSNLPTVVDVQGGASSALGNAPSDGALYLPLALVTIDNAEVVLSAADVADKRHVQPSQACARLCFAATGVVFPNPGVIPYDSIAADPSGNCVTGASASFRVPLPGTYFVTARSRANAATSAQTVINKNAGQVAGGLIPSAASLLCSQAADMTEGCVLGDLIQAANNTSTLTTAGASTDNWMSIRWVGFA